MFLDDGDVDSRCESGVLVARMLVTASSSCQALVVLTHLSLLPGG